MARIVVAGGHGVNNAFGFILIVPEANINQVGAVIATHRKLMKNTKLLDGNADTRLDSYSVIKLPQAIDF